VALELYAEALTQFREIGNTHEEADALYRIGQVHAARHDSALARAYWERALVHYREHHRETEVERTERDVADLG
jgi:hypothetical protein